MVKGEEDGKEGKRKAPDGRFRMTGGGRGRGETEPHFLSLALAWAW